MLLDVGELGGNRTFSVIRELGLLVCSRVLAYLCEAIANPVLALFDLEDSSSLCVRLTVHLLVLRRLLLGQNLPRPWLLLHGRGRITSIRLLVPADKVVLEQSWLALKLGRLLGDDLLRNRLLFVGRV